MKIDKPTCKYGEANCRKHFDGNCMVENDFELRCPIERTINETLEIIDKKIKLAEDCRISTTTLWLVRQDIFALKGGERE